MLHYIRRKQSFDKCWPDSPFRWLAKLKKSLTLKAERENGKKDSSRLVPFNDCSASLTPLRGLEGGGARMRGEEE